MSLYKIYYLINLKDQKIESFTLYGFSFADIIKKFMIETNLTEDHLYKISKITDNL
jgi:hypothetical protein